jgi:predicted RNA binding protein YcfA (HicA-like mRNA interferase family)
VTALPVCSGTQAIRAFERLGWQVHRRRSSHVSMHKPGSNNLLTVPEHRELDVGTLRSLIRDAGVTVADFITALKR